MKVSVFSQDISKYLKCDTVINFDGKYYRVQVGAYSKKDNAEATAKKLRALGFETVIV